MLKVKRHLLLVTAVLAGIYLAFESPLFDERPVAATGAAGADLARAFAEKRSAYQVMGSGVVTRILADDNDGSRHQRFVLRVDSDQTVLVAHNVDLAPRIASVQAGDSVAFYGEYEWNPEGGVIHWTHHDPRGSHVAGWLEHDGRRYQ